jgi:hypothetical protein
MHPQIARACNYFEDFGLIPDEAIDVPTHEQVSVSVWFVESTCGNVILREEFLGFMSASLKCIIIRITGISLQSFYLKIVA